MPTDIRVFIADEQIEVLNHLTDLVNAAGDMRVVGVAKDGGALYDYFKSGQNGVDVALVDIGMPVMDGLTAVTKIKAICKDSLKMIVITGLSGRDYASESVGRHADGFITKYRQPFEILEAIREVYHHSTFVYKPDLSDPSHPTEAPEAPPQLIPIEQRILCMLTQGAISKEISEATNLTVYNVDRIRRLVMIKLEAQNPTMLGVIAERFGICKEIG